ncbi:MAG: RNA polymerase sigma factor [Pseudomonadales bacterium]|nr:RNA polymerase sigma factor [Pseudomonadales bacterium]MCP5184123.1 RNA polymerase sigma factor [Pseudomonadales bacterium]
MTGFANIAVPPEIARGVLRGDRASHGHFFRLVSPRVLGMAWRMLGNRMAAEEVVQDVFVRVIENASDVRAVEALVGWVRSITVNECLMRLRSPWHQRRAAEEPDDRIDDLDGESRVAGESDIERALTLLQPETRMVIWLHDVEGYTHREIGELMGKTASFSKSQLARGYETLLAHWRKQDGKKIEPGTLACHS